MTGRPASGWIIRGGMIRRACPYAFHKVNQVTSRCGKKATNDSRVRLDLKLQRAIVRRYSIAPPTNCTANLDLLPPHPIFILFYFLFARMKFHPPVHPRRRVLSLSNFSHILPHLPPDAINTATPSLAPSPSPVMSSHLHGPTAAPPRRISQAHLLIVTIVLLIIAECIIPGGLTPRRATEQILAKRVAERLDLISRDDPNLVLPGGPFHIDEVHRKALVHRGAWMFSLDSHLRLLLTWRAPSMVTCPMTWAPIGEHAIANETFEDAASRGLAEEATFIPRPRIYAVGQPFFYHHVYNNGTADQRTDNQWTQAYVVLPRGDALDFRTLDDRNAQIGQANAENTRYQGMALPDVVKHAIQRPEYFCHATQVKRILQVIPLVIRVLQNKDQRLFRNYLRDNWEQLVASGSPVCCQKDEESKMEAEVNVSACGVPCEIPPEDISVGDSAT